MKKFLSIKFRVIKRKLIDQIRSSMSNDIYLNDFGYKQRSRFSSLIIFSLTGSISFGILYAYLTKIDEVVTARGELQAYGSNRIIKATSAGQIERIYIGEGDAVKEDQLLISLNTTQLNIKLTENIKQYNLLKQRENLQKPLINKFDKLFSDGGISYIQMIKEKENFLLLKSKIEENKLERDEIKFLINNANIKAPLAGNIFELIPKSKDYVVTKGEVLLTIVPKGNVEAKIFVGNSDIGFIREGMRAEIRVDAYPFTRFGFIEGTVENIGDESLKINQDLPETKFPVYLKLKEQFLFKDKKKFALKTGQSITVNLLVREKPIISIFTDIFKKSLDGVRSIK
tara:strand:- start:484 stop:1509 length:1026 start_codon:yes stop_codon:yes gene_type:complete